MQETQPSIKRTLLGASCLAMQPLALNAMSVPVMAYLIHRIGATGYGQWMIASSLLSTFAVLSNMGLRGAFVRSLAMDRASATSQLAEQLSLRMALAILAAVAAVGVCRLLNYPTIIVRCASVGSIGLIGTALSTTLADFMQAFHRVKTVALVNFISGLLLTIASLLIAVTTTSPVPIAAAYLTGPLVSLCLLIIHIRRLGYRISLQWNPTRFRELLIRSRFFTAQQLLAVGSSQAENLILPKLVGVGQFGFFTAGAILPNRLTAIPDGFCTAAYPVMSQACAVKGPNGLRPLMFKYLSIAAIGGIILAATLSMVARPVSVFLFPQYFAPCAAVLSISAWSLPFVAMESVMGYALNAAGKDAEQSRVSVPAATVGLMVSIFLVSSMGIIGASFSMLLRPCIRVAFLAAPFCRTFGGTGKMELHSDNDMVLKIPASLFRIREVG
jgi:O-antigen/teichoic acid export membrane protein